jgi:hypothetical protein
MSARAALRGLAIESSGDRIAVATFDAAGTVTHERARASAHEHARHLLDVIAATLHGRGRSWA